MASTFALSVALAATTAIAPAHAQESVERTVAADPKGEVEIVNVAGDVQVRGWDRNEVQVHAELGPGVERLDLQSSKGRTTINVIVQGRHNAGSSDIVVELPRQSTVLIRTISADQTVTDVRGVQRLQAVSGSINTQVWSEEFSARTISGDVIVNGHSNPSVAEVNTVSGDVTLANVAGELSLETVTGDMQITMPTMTRGRIQTTNGDLHLQTSLARDARLEAEAINGDLSFLLRSPLNAEFDVETFNGEIDNCFGPKSVRTSEFAPGNALRFKEGDGSSRVRIKTLNGGVEICK
ncbi:MAG: DUF4097 family beta strand repeat-containing protein [Povalibacter sp.]